MRNPWVVIVTIYAITACSPTLSGLQQAATATTSPTQTAVPATATPIPTIEATPVEPNSLTIWMPDVLLPQNTSDDTTDLFNEQVAAFAATEDDLTIEVRRKRVREAGGILATLRAAKDVAPGAMPDLTLVKREDLLLAVQAELVEPMEGFASSVTISNLYNTATQLGQVDGSLFGLPYALEIQHVAYLPGTYSLANAQFETYLEREVTFFFPAARANGLNPIFLSQYLEAGGSIDDSGGLELNEEALFVTLSFYEQAAQAGILPPAILDYTNPLDYRGAFTEGELGATVISSQLYLDIIDDGQPLAFSSIPTASGAPITPLNGWMWVITTTDPNRQLVASAFLEWIMEADRQGAYIRSLDLLPSQRTASRRWYDEDYDMFVAEVMENASLPLGEASGGSVARTMQNALVGVISGEITAEEATQDVMTQAPSLG